MATKKTATKKKAPSKKKASTKKAPAKKNLPDPNTFGILLYLRNSSRHWPQKIRDFRFNKTFGKWIWKGEPIPMEEWNETQERILDEVSTYDFPVHPGMTVVDLFWEPEKPQESPAWQKGLEAAKEKQQQQDSGSEPVKPPTAPDERQRPPERSSEETLY